MIAMNDIRQIWLEQESTSGKNVVRARIDVIPRLNCYIGIIGATGAKMFQMDLETTTASPIHTNFLRKFRGVEIQAVPVSPSQTKYTVILLDKELTDIFTIFIEDIIGKLNPVTESQQALTLINQRVNYWRKLFLKATGELLSAERQRGLYGELFFLKLLLLQSSPNYRQAIYSWRGAGSGNQDFTRGRNAVEIKTTKASHLSVHISNEQQLDFTAWDHLFLGLVSVTETTGSQHSLSGIIKETQDLLTHDPELTREFEARLDAAGIGVDMIDSYNEISYSVNNRRFFCIQDGFPLIRSGNLHSELIYNVKYQIDVSSCESFEIGEEDVIRALV